MGETNLAGPWGLCVGLGALCEGQWEMAVTWRLEGLKNFFFSLRTMLAPLEDKWKWCECEYREENSVVRV